MLDDGAAPAVEPADEVAAVSAVGTVTIEVADRGPGLPPDALPRLFEPFFRVDAARDRGTGGVGQASHGFAASLSPARPSQGHGA